MKGRPLEERPEPLRINEVNGGMFLMENEIKSHSEWILVGSEEDLVEIEP